MKKLSYLLLGLLVFLITGCSEKPYTEIETLSYFEKIYGKNYELVKKEELEDSDEEEKEGSSKSNVIYYMNSDYGFDFEIRTGLSYSESPWGSYHSYFHTDYLEKLFENEEKFNNFVNNYNDVLISWNDDSIFDIDFEMLLSNYDSIEKLNDFMYNFRDLMLDEYKLPEKVFERISLDIYDNNSSRIASKRFSEIFELSKDENLKLLQNCYVNREWSNYEYN